MNMSEFETMLTSAEVAKILKVHISTVRRLYQDSEIAYRKLCHRTVRIYESSVKSYFEREKRIEPKELPDIEPAKTDFRKLPPAGIY